MNLIKNENLVNGAISDIIIVSKLNKERFQHKLIRENFFICSKEDLEIIDVDELKNRYYPQNGVGNNIFDWLEENGYKLIKEK